MRLRSAIVILVLLALATAPHPAHAAPTRMTGKVIDADTQAPIEGAEIELQNASGGPGFHRARTGHGGAFTLENIATDRYYTMSVSADGYADFVLGSWQFPAAQRAVDVSIPLARAGMVEVRVTAADGKTPLSGARVSVRTEGAVRWWEAGRAQPTSAYSDKNGVARFPSLTAGYYTATVEASGLLTSESRRVTVRRGEKTPVVARMVKPASMSGVVRLADGGGLAGLSVTARGAAEGVGTTGTDGTFAIGDLAPGKYRVEVSHEGFEPLTAKETYTLREGESRDGLAFTVTPRAPELAFVLQREVFPPGDPMKVGVRSFRVGLVDLALFTIPVERLLDPASDFRRLAQSGDTTGLTRVQAWQRATPEGPPYAWREEQLTLPATLAPGAYLLRGRAGALERRTIFFVSELGLLVKRSATQVLVSAASLKSGQPVAGALIYPVAGSTSGPAYGTGWSAVLSQAKQAKTGTDADGLAVIPLLGAPSDLRVVAVSATHGIAVAESPLASAASEGGDKVFLYTDRPIYRPGQTVYWKLFARRSGGTGYVIPGATAASLTLRGPDDNMLPMDAAKLSARGSADGAVELPKDVALGEWRLSAAVGRVSGIATLAVEEYRKPEFRVDVTPDREIYVNGDEVRFNVAAAYFFGAPVFGATVRYNLFESRLVSDESEDWSEDESPPQRGFGRVLKTGETRTDIDGRVSILFAPERANTDRRLTLEVEVVDASNRMVSGRGSAIVGRGLFAIAIRPQSTVVNVGDPVVVEVTTKDHAGKPVSAAVTVDLDQEAWNPLERRYTRSARPLASSAVTTDALGRGRASLTPTRSGSVQIHARADDAKGNRITAESWCWVYDAAIADYAYRYPTLEAFADRGRYRPGDTVRVVVNSEVRSGTVLASLEGGEIYEYKVLPLKGGTGLVTFAMKPQYAPNVFVALHVRKGKELHSRVLELPVEAERHDLAISLKSDRETYRPGDSTRVAIETRDGKGAPVAAEVSLGVVDEAIYSLRADTTPEPHDVFYGRRPNWVTTAVAFPTLYFGGADKGGREEVRKDFRDVAFWAPTVLTDERGQGGVAFRFPDNLTTWRLTSRGATSSTLVGKAVTKSLVSKDVVARLAAPRAFVAGDQAVLVSVVNNRTASAVLGLEESIEAKGAASIAGAATRRSDLPPSGESRGEWRVEIPRDLPKEDTASADLTFRARGKTDSDALLVKTPVLPRAVPLRPHAAGVLEARAVTLSATLPSDLVRTGSELWLELSPSPAAMSLGAVDYLVAYPWACTEQTANALIPAAALIKALEPSGAVIPGWEQPTRKFAAHVERLKSLQQPDGGWGWWQQNESDAYITALAMGALARASLAGVATNVDDALQRGFWRTMRFTSNVRTHDGEAYVLAQLTPMLALPNAAQRYQGLKDLLEQWALTTYSARDQLGTAGLALATRAQMELGHATEAKALLAMLMKRALSDGAGLHWPADPEMDNGWFGEEIENTAYALSALLAVTPTEKRAGDVVRWLAQKRRGSYWRCTRTTAPVAVALADYLRAHVAEAKPSYKLAVDWNGERVLERAVSAADVFGGTPMRVRIAGGKLRPGENKLALAKDGAGSAYWAWEARAMVPSPGPDTSPEKRLAVKREILRVERTTDRRGRPQYSALPEDRTQPFRVGEQVMVRLTLRAPQALSFLVIEDPRPAGFEVDALQPMGADWPWGVHGEQRDDRVAFFLDHLDAGETVLEYLVRPEVAGSFAALPTSAGGMYDPDFLVRSAEARLTVAAK